MAKSSVLVTGGAGFIGSHLVERLLREGYRVRVLDNFSTGKERNLPQGEPDLEVIRGSITDPATVEKAVEGVELIFHEAALPSVQRSVEAPLDSHNHNATGTLNVLWAAKQAGVRRLVYAASSSAYGDTPGTVKVETMPTAPLSPYAASKLMGEYYGRIFTELYGLETVCLRYFNVFGPRQYPDSPYSAVIPRFITALAQGGAPVIYGDGMQSRDFTYVDNVVQANLLAAHAPDAAGEVINVAIGQEHSLLELLAELGAIMGVNPQPHFLPARPGDPRHSLADLDKARRLLDYQPVVSFREGLRKTVEWLTLSTPLSKGG